LDKMNVRSRCPQCNSVRIVEIAPSNVGNTYDLNKARCDNCGYKYGDDWKDLV
jgi:predicted Zn-ribbon and HTH transcriptional regulator